MDARVEPYANLTRANLRGAYLRRANLTEADLTRADLTRANLTEADLTEANLTRADLTRANLTRADLIRADLTRADLTEANLTGASLAWANLPGANLAWADLYQANLAGADLTGAVLYLANLSGALLKEANLKEANLTGTCLDPSAAVPLVQDWRGLEVVDGYVYGYRTRKSQHVGSTDYESGKTYTAPYFSVCTLTDCHPGIYLATNEWLDGRGYSSDRVRVRARIEHVVRAGDKFRAKEVEVL